MDAYDVLIFGIDSSILDSMSFSSGFDIWIQIQYKWTNWNWVPEVIGTYGTIGGYWTDAGSVYYTQNLQLGRPGIEDGDATSNDGELYKFLVDTGP